MLRQTHLALLLLLPFLAHAATKRCQPCQSSCWPNETSIAGLESSIDGSVIRPSDEERFERASVVYNYRFYRSPGLIVEPKSADDIKKAIGFAQKHNMLFSVKSSGHDFIGRSTAYGSLLLNMRTMQSIKVNMSDPRSETGATVTVESGATWIEVYNAVDEYGRVVIGGSSPEVCMGGYTTGGGHSPMSRMYGLAVDNVVAFQIVTANQQLRSCTVNGCDIIHDNGTVESVPDSADLFWAVRGGGGAFGVVINFTFKIHQPPSQFVQATVGWPINSQIFGSVGRRVIDFYNGFLKTMPKEWGGYLTVNNFLRGDDSYDGQINLALLHVGPWEQAYPSIKPLLDTETEAQLYQTTANFSTFMEYQNNVDDYAPARNYVVNKFIQLSDLGTQFTDLVTDHLLNTNTRTRSCTGTHIGGKVTEPALSSAAISEGFRNGILSLSCGYGWQNEYLDDLLIGNLKDYAVELYKLGKNVYLNEPDSDVVDWKNEFWFPHYDTLLGIKQKYDPGNFFTYKKAVGWDMNSTSTEI